MPRLPVFRLIVVLFAALVGLASCSSLSKEECVTADWRTIGYQDGASGAPADVIGTHRQACAKHGVAPNLEAYLFGRDEGLRTYCRPQRAFTLGAEGYSYYGVCPVDLERSFLASYNEGQGLYVRRERVYELNAALTHAQSRSEEIVHVILAKEIELVSPDVSMETRAHLLIEIKNLAGEREALLRQIPGLAQEHALAVRELDAYEQRLASTQL